MSNGSYPVRVDLRAPNQVANWRPLVHWLLVIPHLLVVYGVRDLRTVLTGEAPRPDAPPPGPAVPPPPPPSG